MGQLASFDLFLDESGLFTETSTDPTEQAAASAQSRQFPSQLAGLVVPRGELSTGRARTIVNEALKAGGLPPQPLHACDLPRPAYNSVIQSAVERILARGWQPVRLVNRERVRYGDRVATYTNLVAELVLRICQRKWLEGASPIMVRIFAARVRLDEKPDGELVLLERDEYKRRIVEYLGVAGVRHGLAQAANAWVLDELHIGSGKDDPALQLCDLISHASHADFHPCKPETATLLAQAFGPYDFSLVYRELIERVDGQLASDAIGLAVLSLAERFCGEPMSPDLRAIALRRLAEVRARLAGLGSPARDQHLSLLVSWLEQIIEVRRALDLGYRLCGWILEEIAAPLVSDLAGGPEAGSLDWFVYALRTWALTACNHRGALQDAQQQMGQMQDLLPRLAGQWEHASLLMRGLVAQGVHLTDRFEHDDASARMKVAAQYYGELGAMFHLALPELFPERVRSDLYGRVLGTWLQSEIYAGLCQGRAARLDAARKLSEQAIDEFPAEADKRRQYQYRCQLETAIGNFAEARRFLADSLGLHQDTHEALAAAIGGLNEPSPLAAGFAQLHWFRLGVAACLKTDQAESAAFLSAVDQTGALDWPWSRLDGPADYPVHGILRRAAVIRALRGEAGPATECLRRLAAILAVKLSDRVVLQTIRLAAHAETAAVLYGKHAKQARGILDSNEADCPGLSQLLTRLAPATATSFPGISRVFEDWGPAVQAALQGDPTTRPAAATRLVALARRIGY